MVVEGENALLALRVRLGRATWDPLAEREEHISGPLAADTARIGESLRATRVAVRFTHPTDIDAMLDGLLCG
jgi:hypothetical protein